MQLLYMITERHLHITLLSSLSVVRLGVLHVAMFKYSLHMFGETTLYTALETINQC